MRHTYASSHIHTKTHMQDREGGRWKTRCSCLEEDEEEKEREKTDVRRRRRTAIFENLDVSEIRYTITSPGKRTSESTEVQVSRVLESDERTGKHTEREYRSPDSGEFCRDIYFWFRILFIDLENDAVVLTTCMKFEKTPVAFGTCDLSVNSC